MPDDVLDEILAIQGDAKKKPCAFTRATDTFDADIKSGIMEAMQNPAVTSVAISAWLKRRGHNVGQATIQRHRRGDCNCG